MRRNLAVLIMILLIVLAGTLQGWVLALSIVQLCLISAIMSLGVNMQWGYAGIFNVGIVGFAALGGLAAVLVGHEPIAVTIEAGSAGILAAIYRLVVVVVIMAVIGKYQNGTLRNVLFVITALIGFFWVRAVFAPAIGIIESTDAAKTGFLGGLGMPILLSWIVGGIFAALAAWGIGKMALGLRSDYLAIATLGISEIIVAIIRNESWLTRGVKNVTKLPRPVPYEIDLQEAAWFVKMCDDWGFDIQAASSIFVKLCYIGLFSVVLVALFWLMQRAQKSPWGRMMRAIRDNRDAAEAMGKDVKRRHLQIFVLGSAVIGIAGAMLTTFDGQLIPTAYQPLRFTFLIWVMVIVGGSGNNWGAIIGGFFIWFFWVEAEKLGPLMMQGITFLIPEGTLKAHLISSAEQMRLVVMGLILILTLRFAPKGILPEENR